jgi:hypothetical protein
MYNKNMFMDILKENSESKDYNEFIDEWRLKSYLLLPKTNHCICGIIIDKNFIIKNELNDKELIVGSTCIKRFMKQEMYDEANKILRYEKFINNNNETILESGRYKNMIYKDIFIKHPDYVNFITNIRINDKNLKRFIKYCVYYKYLLEI